MQLRLLGSSMILVSASLFTNAVFAEEPKAIWGTDGAAITKQNPQLKPAPAAAAKPAVSAKQTVSGVVKEPAIAKPATSPQAIVGYEAKPVPGDVGK